MLRDPVPANRCVQVPPRGPSQGLALLAFTPRRPAPGPQHQAFSCAAECKKPSEHLGQHPGIKSLRTSEHSNAGALTLTQHAGCDRLPGHGRPRQPQLERIRT